MYVFIYVYIYIYICVYVCIYIYIYIYIYVRRKLVSGEPPYGQASRIIRTHNLIFQQRPLEFRWPSLGVVVYYVVLLGMIVYYCCLCLHDMIVYFCWAGLWNS